jgi:hypothetical protein
MAHNVMRVVVVTPFRAMGCDHRKHNFAHVAEWIAAHHPFWRHIIGDSDRDPFSPAQARNNGARQADWDVCVFWDADTIVHPDSIHEAVTLAADTDQMVIAGTGHIYMNELSTSRYLDSGLMFPQPTDWADTNRQRFLFDERSVYRAPCSGVLAVTRPLWEATGGYVDSLGGQDSHEDLIFYAQAQIFGGAVTRVEGMQLHLWHPAAPRIKGANQQLYRQLVGKPAGKARALLAQHGHTVP